MKQHLLNAVRAFVLALGCAALGALVIALMLTLYDIERTVLLAALPWAALLLLLALILEALTARGSNMLVYAAVCAAILLPGSHQIVLRTQFIPGSSGFPILLRVIILLSGGVCAYAVQKLPGSDVFVRLGDTLIIAMTCYLSAAFFLGDALIMPILTLALCAFGACLMTTAQLRAGGESDSVIRGTGAGGLLVLAALFFVCLLLCCALLTLSNGHVESFVSFLLAVWTFAARIIRRAFELFVYMIALFAPKPVHYNYASMQEEAPAVIMGGTNIDAQMPQWVIYIFIAGFVLLALSVVAAILWLLRGTKLSRRKARRARRVTRQSKMLSALRERLCALKEHIAFETAYRHNRRTPQGLYVLAVRTCRTKQLKKRPSESPGAYIRRLHGVLLEKSGMSTLDALAGKLDRILYAGESVPLSHGESDAFAAQIAAVRQIDSAKRPDSL